MPSYHKSVFINCPFDERFAPLFQAMVLTVGALGFIPRCARETEGEADPRIIRIAKGMTESKYSIHDLSRYEGEGPENLARFNMPLELGMALAIRYERRAAGNTHNWVALVPEHFIHQRFVSDLAGYDCPPHDEQPQTVIKAVAGWLTIQPDFVEPAPSARTIFSVYPKYTEALEEAQIEALGTLTWPAMLKNAARVISGMETPLI